VDEERQRAKKKEEILKNIERARRRREEEERRYKTMDSAGEVGSYGQDMFRGPVPTSNEEAAFFKSTTMNRSSAERERPGSFGAFDVDAQRPRQKSDSPPSATGRRMDSRRSDEYHDERNRPASPKGQQGPGRRAPHEARRGGGGRDVPPHQAPKERAPQRQPRRLEDHADPERDRRDLQWDRQEERGQRQQQRFKQDQQAQNRSDRNQDDDARFTNGRLESRANDDRRSQTWADETQAKAKQMANGRQERPLRDQPDVDDVAEKHQRRACSQPQRTADMMAPDGGQQRPSPPKDVPREEEIRKIVEKKAAAADSNATASQQAPVSVVAAGEMESLMENGPQAMSLTPLDKGFTPRGQPSRRGRGGGGRGAAAHPRPQSGAALESSLAEASIVSEKDAGSLMSADGDLDKSSKGKKLQQPPGMMGAASPHMQGKHDRGQGKQQNQYERRQNKLPPRLAKQREQNRMAQKGLGFGNRAVGEFGGVGGGSAWGNLDDAPVPAPGAAGVWGTTDLAADPGVNDPGANLLDRLGDLRMKQGGDARENNDLPVNTTLIFENTNLKTSRPSVASGTVPPADLHLPIGFAAKQERKEDAAPPDLKLDFGTFDADAVAAAAAVASAANAAVSSADMTGQPVANPSNGGMPDDINLNQAALDLKIASVKKVWDIRPDATPGGAGAGGSPFVPPRFQSEAGVAIASEAGPGPSSGPTVGMSQPSPGAGGSGTSFGVTKHESQGDRDGTAVNVAKVRPQQQVPHPPSALPHYSGRTHGSPTSCSGPGDYDRGGVGIGLGSQHPAARNAAAAAAVVAANFAVNNRAVAAMAGNNNIAASLASPPSLYQAFGNQALGNHLYPYAGLGLGGQFLPPHHQTANDLFGASNQFRLPLQQVAQFQQQHSGNGGLLPQHQSSLKQQQGHIGPIGSKGGGVSGAGSAGGLGGLALIPYDTAPYMGQQQQQRHSNSSMGSNQAYFPMGGLQQQSRQQQQQQHFGFPTTVSSHQSHFGLMPASGPPTSAATSQPPLSGGGNMHMGLSSGYAKQHQPPHSSSVQANDVGSGDGAGPITSASGGDASAGFPAPIRRPQGRICYIFLPPFNMRFLFRCSGWRRRQGG